MSTSMRYVFHEINIDESQVTLQGVVDLINLYREIWTDLKHINSKYKSIKNLIPKLTYTVLINRSEGKQTARLYFNQNDIPETKINTNRFTAGAPLLNGVYSDTYNNTNGSIENSHTFTNYTGRKGQENQYKFLQCFFIPYKTEKRVSFTIVDQNSNSTQTQHRLYQSNDNKFKVYHPKGIKFFLAPTMTESQQGVPALTDNHLIVAYNTYCKENSITKDGELYKQNEDKLLRESLNSLKKQVETTKEVCNNIIQKKQLPFAFAPSHTAFGSSSSGSREKVGNFVSVTPGTGLNAQPRKQLDSNTDVTNTDRISKDHQRNAPNISTQLNSAPNVELRKQQAPNTNVTNTNSKPQDPQRNAPNISTQLNSGSNVEFRKQQAPNTDVTNTDLKLQDPHRNAPNISTQLNSGSNVEFRKQQAPNTDVTNTNSKPQERHGNDLNIITQRNSGSNVQALNTNFKSQVSQKNKTVKKRGNNAPITNTSFSNRRDDDKRKKKYRYKKGKNNSERDNDNLHRIASDQGGDPTVEACLTRLKGSGRKPDWNNSTRVDNEYDPSRITKKTRRKSKGWSAIGGTDLGK